MLRRLVSLNVVSKTIRAYNKPLSTSAVTCQRFDDFEDDEFGGRARGSRGGGGGGGWGQRGDMGGDRGGYGGDRGGYGRGGGYDDGMDRGGYGGRPQGGRRYNDFDDGADRRGGYGAGSYGGGDFGGRVAPRMAPPIDPEKQRKSIFLASLPWSATEEEMVQFCSQAGKVEEFRIIYDRQTGRSKGYGFCQFADEETAKNAVAKLDNAEFQGRNLVVKPPKAV